MRDFTLKRYRSYLIELIKSDAKFMTFAEYISTDISERPKKYVLLRHDVDRKPQNALKMAKLENELGLQATYYFRSRKNIAVPEIMEEIHLLGHEVGYHYECLSDCNGHMNEAHKMFQKCLSEMRKIVPVKTISMHGSPLKPYDNRDMWRGTDEAQKLLDLDLLGEIYLSIDYSNIAYVNDTGRNWFSKKSNRRDRVNSEITVEFKNSSMLLNYFSKPHPELVFQVHPERWADSLFEWTAQYCKDLLINLAKILIQIVRR